MKIVILTTVALFIGALPVLADTREHMKEQFHTAVHQAYQDHGRYAEKPNAPQFWSKFGEAARKLQHNVHPNK